MGFEIPTNAYVNAIVTSILSVLFVLMLCSPGRSFYNRQYLAWLLFYLTRHKTVQFIVYLYLQFAQYHLL